MLNLPSILKIAEYLSSILKIAEYLSSTLEVAAYLSSTDTCRQKNLLKKIEVQAEEWLSLKEEMYLAFKLLL